MSRTSIRSREELQALLQTEDPLGTLISLEESCRQDVVEMLQMETLEATLMENNRYRRRCLKCLREVVKQYHLLPSSMFLRAISDPGRDPVAGGSYADIYKACIGNQIVCLKVIRLHTVSDIQQKEKLRSIFYQEALLWKNLNHPNILPFLGVNSELFEGRIILVSPWMLNGDLISYLKEHPEHDRLQSVFEIAAGLKYLHSQSIVHADIKGANILVDENRICCLADFGLAAIAASSLTTGMSSGNSRAKGTVRWMAPEILNLEGNPREDERPRDVYAFACTVYEIMTGKVPFYEIQFEFSVITNVIRGKRPSRPQSTDAWCPNEVWRLVEQCWAETPEQRLGAARIHFYLRSFIGVQAFKNFWTSKVAVSNGDIVSRYRSVMPSRSTQGLLRYNFNGKNRKQRQPIDANICDPLPGTHLPPSTTPLHPEIAAAPSPISDSHLVLDYLGHIFPIPEGGTPPFEDLVNLDPAPASSLFDQSENDNYLLLSSLSNTAYLPPFPSSPKENSPALSLSSRSASLSDFGQRVPLYYFMDPFTGSRGTVDPIGSTAINAKPITESHNLQYHIYSHLGISPFKCQMCGRGFIAKSDCKSHEKRCKYSKDSGSYPAGRSMDSVAEAPKIAQPRSNNSVDEDLNLQRPSVNSAAEGVTLGGDSGSGGWR